jgi:hypothetical protein
MSSIFAAKLVTRDDCGRFPQRTSKPSWATDRWCRGATAAPTISTRSKYSSAFPAGAVAATPAQSSSRRTWTRDCWKCEIFWNSRPSDRVLLKDAGQLARRILCECFSFKVLLRFRPKKSSIYLFILIGKSDIQFKY